MENTDSKFCKEILIVEDDEAIRTSLRLALELAGFQVTTAANGQEGLEHLKKISRPCLILLDLMMPVMNGWQFAEALQKDMVLAAIPVAIVTAYSDRAKDIQAQAIVKKPIDLGVLMKIVHQYCGRGIYE